MLRPRPKFTLFPDDPNAGVEKDRIELRSVEYHERVRRNYLSQAKIKKFKYRVVDANRGFDDVHKDVMSILETIKL